MHEDPFTDASPFAVVFDLDGTLVNSAPDLHAAAAGMAAELDLPAPGLADIVSYMGNGIPALVTQCLDAAGLPPAAPAREAALARFLALYEAAPAALTTPNPGIDGLLSGLRDKGVRLGVCTNKPEGASWQVLRATGLASFFDALVGGDTLPVRKPDPTPLRTVFDRLGAGGFRRVYVGDGEVDAQTAAAAAIPFALFTGGYRKTSVSAIAHDLAFDTFDALDAQLLALAR